MNILKRILFFTIGVGLIVFVLVEDILVWLLRKLDNRIVTEISKHGKNKRG